MEATAEKAKRTRKTHALPNVVESGSIDNLKFRKRVKGSRYDDIVATILGLSTKHSYVAFVPGDGEAINSLKARVSGLVSRVCKDKAPPGLCFRTRVTEDGKVIVFLDEAKAAE